MATVRQAQARHKRAINFHRWTVIDETQERICKGRLQSILCRCECGTERNRFDLLQIERTWSIQKAADAFRKKKQLFRQERSTHGMTEDEGIRLLGEQ